MVKAQQTRFTDSLSLGALLLWTGIGVECECSNSGILGRLDDFFLGSISSDGALRVGGSVDSSLLLELGSFLGGRHFAGNHSEEGDGKFVVGSIGAIRARSSVARHPKGARRCVDDGGEEGRRGEAMDGGSGSFVGPE
jgi:hypothetical protein